jgi:hypothetical protein
MAKKLSRAEKIRRFLNANPHMALKDVAKKFDTTYQVVYMVRKNMPKKVTLTATEAMLAKKIGVSTEEYAKQKVKLTGRKPRSKPVEMPPTPETGDGYVYRWVNTNALSEDAKDELASKLITMEEPVNDPVNNPAHYTVGGIDTIDFIEAKGLSYHLGNAIKYISRSYHKGSRRQDLEKAIWYINRELSRF